MSFTAKKRTLLELRSEICMSQEKLEAESNVSQTSISRVESGFPISKGYKLRLLFSLNRLRKQRGFDELTLDDIAWPEKGTKA